MTSSRSPKKQFHPFKVYEILRYHDHPRNHEYHLTQFLGEGGFAKCYKGRRMTDGRVFAIKAISLKDSRDQSRDKNKRSGHPRASTKQKAIAEAKFLKTCQHPNITSYVTDFIYNEVFYIVMEYCENGSVNDMLRQRINLTEVEARYYVRQMVEGLIYIRSKRIIHRDLKPANYLLTQNIQLKIADFGLATEVRNNQPVLTNVCGTPNFLSPQMLFKRTYSYQVDVWSIGVALYAMLFGRPPFETEHKDAEQTYKRIKKCDYTFIHDKISISDDAKDLISRILILQPNRRIYLQRILDHPFVSSFKIPRELPVECLKSMPDSKFLKRYKSKLEPKQNSHQNRGRSEPSKEKRSKNQKQPMRFCPPEECEKQERKTSKSFSDSSSQKYENQLSDKKQLKKQKSEKKQIEEIERNRPKSMMEVMKKIQKEEMLTSSPISSNCSMKSGSIINKFIPYPIQNPILSPEFVQIKYESIPMSSKILNDNKIVLQKQNIRQDGEIIEQHQESQKANLNIFKQIPFPSFKHMMKPLSFDGEFWNNQNRLQYINSDRHKELAQLITKKKTGDVKVITQNSRSMSKSKRIQLETPKQKIAAINSPDSRIYPLEDFLLFTSSLHLATPKLIKMVYCLKEQQFNPSLQKISSSIISNHPKFEARFIGSIFFDNSSIVTKVHQIGKELKYSSIYIRNVENSYQNRRFETDLIENLPLLDYDKMAKGQNQFVLDIDIFEGKSMKTTKQKLHYDMMLKIKLAKDGIKLFKKRLTKSFPQLFDKKINKSTTSPTIFDLEFHKIDDFKFIQMFQTRKSTLYFELNDYSKHYLEKKASQKNHLDLFRDTDEKAKMKSYQYAMYFSVKRLVFIRKAGEEKFATFNTENLKFIDIVNEQNAKKCEEEENESNFYDTCSKKIKPNEQRSQSLTSQKSKKEPNIPEFQPNEILLKICNEFKQKLDMFYIRERDAMKSGTTLENRFCEIGIAKGMFDFKLKKTEA